MRIQNVTARQNPTVKLVYSLRDKKYRDENGFFVTEGTIPLQEGLDSGYLPVYLLAREDFDLSCPLIRRLEQMAETSFVCHVLSDSAFEKISSDKGSEGLVCVWNQFMKREEELEKSIASSENRFYLILEGLQDPGNLGTILRSALAFGCGGVFLCDCVDIYNPKVVRASMGNMFRMPFARVERLEDLRARMADTRWFAAAVTPGGLMPSQMPQNEKIALLIGNEGQGLSDKAMQMSDASVHIPMRGTESLNAAVAASILMWEAGKGR